MANIPSPEPLSAWWPGHRLATKFIAVRLSSVQSVGLIVDTESGVSEENISPCRNNFHLFGRGPGSCPGENMALLEMMLTVAKTLHHLDVHKAAGDTLGEGSPDQQWGQRDRNIFQMQDGYISILRGPTIQFRKRKL